jgi:FkbM family methyltransferase
MYSQKDEEYYITRAVSGMVGTFIDVGAYDGLTYSNTRCLVERGWRGLMVEPGLDAFKTLLDKYEDETNIILVHGVLSCAGEHLTNFWHNPRTFSTTLPEVRDQFIHEGFSRSYITPTTSWNALLTLCPTPDVVSIDTEGTSVALFENLMMRDVRPLVICVEHEGKISRCLQLASRFRYKVVMQNEENFVLERGA